ncbi:phage baseplate assembly protein V [Rouxiella sp. Mn2063]|uniref:phage baseplate assembly protein V n=1 Tax=Rouxiella sp. Mn2063 TaxID=3395262 RepID=UPI003BCDB008
MSEEVLGDLQRRLANMVRRGVIHSINNGPQPVCRVALGEIVTGWLPLYQTYAGQNRADSNPYMVGDAVTVLSEAGDLNNGRVLPGWNTGKLPVPLGDDGEHITTYGDGTEVRYNRNSHALRIKIANNGTYEIIGQGTLRGPVEITDTLTVQGETTLNSQTAIRGNLSVTGEISDGKSTIDRVREIFNSHNHAGDSGGITGKPNQPM